MREATGRAICSWANIEGFSLWPGFARTTRTLYGSNVEVDLSLGGFQIRPVGERTCLQVIQSRRDWRWRENPCNCESVTGSRDAEKGLQCNASLPQRELSIRQIGLEAGELKIDPVKVSLVDVTGIETHLHQSDGFPVAFEIFI